MKRVIKITEAQLRETEGEAFKYLDTSDDTSPFNGQSTITAQGKLNGEENAEPIFTDRIGKQRTPQAWARYRMYGNINQAPHAKSNNIDLFNEGVSIKPSVTVSDGNIKDNGINDFDEDVAMMGMGNGVETMSDNNSNNNLCVIPNGIDKVTDRLINMISDYNLNPKQIAMVLDKIQESFPQIAQNGEAIKQVLRQQVDPQSIKDFD
jgi:hypothetical protein